MSITAKTRQEIEDFLIDYTTAIDDGALDRWPDFFGDPCLYKIVAKENYDSGLPLALLLCDSPGMIQDRCDAFAKLNVFGPRTWRHMTGSVRLTEDGGAIKARSNFVIFETLAGKDTHVLCAGEYCDVIVREAKSLKFRERLCIYDTTMIPNSIVMPL
ncbi:MAG: aromatic-ring-hydroxylating dioxygenase subunit beta [Rhodospirillaceae bacterium]|mgnify:FL=1|nr:aromatic-ring-hydroxylating dioxygenase subunit beta [Rhodospirillaceae bacterium]MBT5455642.1 aromatic-ring-hydroxylating dioxygenase subunit beta [Rhodospirillaceae bacterium]